MELIAEKRTTLGKKTHSLRAENKIPAVLFGRGIESVPLQVDLNGFTKVYRDAGETSVVYVKIGSKKEPTLIKEVQLHPVTSRFLHIAFHKVDLTEKISADIPVEVVGEEENELIKSGEAMSLQLLSEISVSALPTDLPHAFIVDVSKLAEIGDTVTVATLDFDKSKVEIEDLDPGEVVVKLDYAEMQEVEEEVVSEEALIEGMEATEETTEEASGEDVEGEKVSAKESSAGTEAVPIQK